MKNSSVARRRNHGSREHQRTRWTLFHVLYSRRSICVEDGDAQPFCFAEKWEKQFSNCRMVGRWMRVQTKSKLLVIPDQFHAKRVPRNPDPR